MTPKDITFAADAMLGRLARWLRVLGYDTLYNPHIPIHELVKIAQREKRLLLTRNRGAAQEFPDQTLFIPEQRPKDQLRFLIQRFQLDTRGYIFSRCVLCNVMVQRIPREEAAPHVPGPILESQSVFYRCPVCSKVYWEGSHLKRVRQWIDAVERQP